MIEVSVKAILDIRRLMGGTKIQTIFIEEDSTVRELLFRLIDMYGKELGDRIFNENGEIKAGITLFVNGKVIYVLDGLETKLNMGDELIIFPPVGGG